MKRKVIQIAGSTQLVSLPRAWALAHNVKKGDELEVEAEGENIVVSTQKKGEIESITIKLPSKEQFLKRTITSLYIHGYDEIIVEIDDPTIVPLIQQAIDDCLGYEIVGQTSNSCVIKSVVAGSSQEFDIIFRKTMIMLVEMAKDAYSAVQQKDKQRLAELTSRERSNNKLSLFCLRLLNKYGYKEHKKTTTLYAIICLLENVVDYYRDFCKYVLANKPALSRQFMQLFSEVVGLTETFYEIFYKYEMSKAFDFKRKMQKANEAGTRIFKAKKGHEIILTHYLLEILDRLHHSLVYIA